MFDFLVNPIKCGTETGRCVLNSRSSSIKGVPVYTLVQVRLLFSILISSIHTADIPNKLGMRGSIRRPILHLFVLAARVFVRHVLAELEVWKPSLYLFYKSKLYTGNELDFEKLQSPDIWNGVFDELIVHTGFMEARVHLALIIQAIQDNDEELANEVFLDRFVLFCEDRELTEDDKQILLRFALNHPDFDKTTLDAFDVVQQEVQLVPAIGDPANLDIYRELCTLLRNECSSFHMPHACIMNGEYDTEDKCKGLLLNALLMPYMRYSSYDPEKMFHVFPKIVCEERNFNYKTYCENFNVMEWVGGSSFTANGTLAEKVKEKKDTIMALISDLDNESERDMARDTLKEMIVSLKRKTGFVYSIHGLSYLYNRALDMELNRKNHGKLAYKLTDLEKILSGITNTPLEYITKKRTRSTIVETIMAHNPHVIKNALSIYIREPLLDIDFAMFYKSSKLNVGFDLIEVMNMIISSKGKNEMMGLPDYPDLKVIWEGTQDITDLLYEIHAFLIQEDDDTYKEQKTELIDFTRLMFKETQEDIDALFNNALFKWCDLEELDFLNREHIQDVLTKESLLPLKAIVYYIEKQYFEERRQYGELLKDINLLHIVGLLGWIMLSDKVSSYSQDANDFDITNYCKGLVETYVMRLMDAGDKDNDQCFYTIPNKEYHNVFNKHDILKQILDLNYAGQTLGSIINAPMCLHGIGGQLVMVYLKSLKKLNLIKDEIGKPFYLNDDLMKPLPIFQEVGDGYYIYAVNNYDTKEKNPDSLSSDEYSFENYRHTLLKDENGFPHESYKFSVQLCHPQNGYRSWCGKVYIDQYPGTDNPIYRLFDGKSLRYIADINSEYSIMSRYFFQELRSKQWLYVSDLYMKHRKEHFKVFLRYVIDFSNMLHEYADPAKGILQERKEGLKVFIDLSEDALSTNKLYIPFKSIEEVHYNEDMTEEEMIDFVMSRMYAAYYFSEDDLRSEFKKKFSQHFNVNATVGRDYNTQMSKLSKLVYFHDLLGSMSSLYESKFRWKENNEQVESYYGLIGNERNVADKLVANLMKAKGLNKSFNHMISSKAMISRIIMKFTNRNVLNPHFFVLNKDGEDNTELLYRQKLATVSHFMSYINLNVDDIKNPNDIDECMNAYLKAIIYFIYFKTMIEVIIKGTAAVQEDSPFLTFRRLLNKSFFASFRFTGSDSSLMFMYDVFNDYRYPGAIGRTDINMVKKSIKEVKKAIVEGLWKFMSLLFDPDESMSYNYSIENMYMYEDYLKDIGTIVQRNGGNLDELKRLVASPEFKGDEKQLLKPFIKASGPLFPGDDNLLFHPGMFLSEMVDISSKYDLMMTLINNYFPRLEGIFNKIQSFKMTKINREEDTQLYNDIANILFKKVVVERIHYLNILEREEHLHELFELLDIKEPIDDALSDQEKEKIRGQRMNRLFHVLIKILFTYTYVNPNEFESVPSLLTTICAVSYEHADRY